MSDKYQNYLLNKSELAPSFLKEDLKSHLKHYFGFNTFKEHQENIIYDVLDKKDVLVIMPTGGGKSLCYQLPALISQGTAIIVSPLIALMKNQVDGIRALAMNDSIAHVLNSSLNKSEIKKVLEDLISNQTKLLYIAPETLNKEEYIDLLRNIEISFFAIDEAHCISEWGHDFRPEYRNLRSIIDRITKASIIALTATATAVVEEDIQKILGITKAKLYKSSFNRPNLYYEVRAKVNPEKEIIKYIKERKGQSGIIYCLSRKKVEEFSHLLQANGIKSLPYHAGLDAKTRSKHQDIFLKEDMIIVATIAFGMGIDKPNVRFVIHYDISKSLEGYYQETGRAGRDGDFAECIAFYDYKDIEKLEKFIFNKPLPDREVGLVLLNEVVAYAETSISRRKYLLHYFGEKFDENAPGADMDDNVRYPKKKIEAKEELYKILSLFEKHKEGVKVKDFMSFFLEEQIDHNDDKKIEQYLICDEKRNKIFLMGLLRRAILEGFLKKEIQKYNLLKLTDKGKDFIENPYSFEISEDHNYEELIKKQLTPNFSTEALDKKLLSLLKNLRQGLSKEKNIPSFVIFQDASLNDMATHYPVTLEEFSQIFGIGEGKVKKWGNQFIELIKKYIEENQITRPSELLLLKQSNHKITHKISIIQNIDRKIHLEEIAKSRGLSMVDLIGQMEQIVYQGTKLCIDYFLKELFDKEQIDEIFDYFMNAKNDSIKEALDYFEYEYTEEDMRLIRIKFINDIAN